MLCAASRGHPTLLASRTRLLLPKPCYNWLRLLYFFSTRKGSSCWLAVRWCKPMPYVFGFLHPGRHSSSAVPVNSMILVESSWDCLSLSSEMHKILHHLAHTKTLQILGYILEYAYSVWGDVGNLFTPQHHLIDRQNLWAHLWNSICCYRFWGSLYRFTVFRIPLSYFSWTHSQSEVHMDMGSGKKQQEERRKERKTQRKK